MSTSKIEYRLLSYDDITLLYKRFLRYIGLLPFDGRDFTYLGTRLLLIYHLVFVSVFSSMYTFYAINQGEKISVDTILETVAAVGVCIRYYLLTQWRLELKDLLDNSQAIWELCDDGGRRVVQHFEQKIRLLFGFLLGSTSISSTVYCLTAISLTMHAKHHNDSHTRFLPYKWYTENGQNLWPGYKIIFSLQVLVVNNACIITTAVDSTGPLLIMIGAGYFCALRHRILRISGYEDELAKIDEELLACIRIHQQILTFCSRIENLTRSLFMVQVVCTCYDLSLAGIKFIGVCLFYPFTLTIFVALI